MRRPRENRFKERLRKEGLLLCYVLCCVQCPKCGAMWYTEDPDFVGVCPHCTAERIEAKP